MSLELVNMLMPDADLTICYDFGGVSIQEKMDFLCVVFILLKDVVEAQENISEEKYVEIYNAQFENIISDLNGTYNFTKFSRFFIRYFGEHIVRDDDVEPIWWTFFQKKCLLIQWKCLKRMTTTGEHLMILTRLRSGKKEN